MWFFSHFTVKTLFLNLKKQDEISFVHNHCAMIIFKKINRHSCPTACLYCKVHWCYQNQLSQKPTTLIRHMKYWRQQLASGWSVSSILQYHDTFFPPDGFPKTTLTPCILWKLGTQYRVCILKGRNQLLLMCEASCLFSNSGGILRTNPAYKNQLNIDGLFWKANRGLTDHQWQQEEQVLHEFYLWKR